MLRHDSVDRYFAVRDHLESSGFSGLESMEPRVLLSSAAFTQVKVRNASALEGDTTSPSTMFFVVKRTGDVSGTSIARYRTTILANVPNAALPASEFVAKTGRVRFDPGQTKAIAKVQLVGDENPESDAAFGLQLFKVRNATAQRALATGIVRDDDTGIPGAVNPNITITDVARVEGNAASQVYAFTVALSQPTSTTVTVDFNTSNGSAKVADNDYVPATGTLTFAPGTTTQVVNVTVNGDTTAELDETFFVNLAGAKGAFITDATGRGTIQNDDGGPSMRITDAAITEGNAGTKNLRFTVTISGALDETISVDYTTAGGTATEGTDFTAATGTVTFEPGETSKTIDVAIIGDTTIEKDETFTVGLSNLQLVDPSDPDLDIDDLLTLAGPQATGTITNDDAAPSVTITDVSKLEGNGGATAFRFDLTLSAEALEPVSVDYRITDGTATDADNDFSALDGTVTFAAGETTQSIVVNVIGDTRFEANEEFFIDLINPTKLTLGDNQARGVILNDDLVPELSINSVTVTEQDTGETVNAVFTVTLSQAAGADVTVSYSTANGTATAGSDYTATSGTLTFTPGGPLTRTLIVPVLGDNADELATESFYVNLSAPTNATIADGQGVGLITDDDGAPSLSITDAAITEGDSGTRNLNFTVTLVGEAKTPVTVNYTTVGGTATSGTDFTPATGTLTFPVNATTRTISVPIIGDILDEANETFQVNLSTPSGAEIADGQAIGTITDDDDTVTVSIADASITEGDSGTKNLSFTVTRAGILGGTATVNYATAGGTATSGVDFSAASGTLTFTPGGPASQTVVVPILGDIAAEDDETFTVTLSAASGFTIADAQAIGTILDDDVVPSISIINTSVTEGDSGQVIATANIIVSGAVKTPITVNYTTANGTAAAGSDYVAESGSVTFNPGGPTSLPVTIAVNGDFASEVDENFFINLTGTTGGAATIIDNQGEVTINDDDDLPFLIISDVSATEGNSGTKKFQFKVTLSEASDVQVRVNYDPSDGSATTADQDYIDQGARTLFFAPGETVKFAEVEVRGDTISEGQEDFEVKLSEAVNATIQDGDATGFILDDDQPTISILDAQTTEGNAGTKNMTFTVNLSNPSDQTVTVDFDTQDAAGANAATAGVDYDAKTGVLTFTPGQTSKQVTITINGDTTVEPDEVFRVLLSNAAGGATILDGLGVGTILDDD